MYNGYETEELVQAHIRALIKEMEDSKRVGNGARADLARAELRKFGHKVSKPQAAAETREAPKRKPGRPRKSESQ